MNYDYQKIIGHSHKCLSGAFIQGDHYANNLDGLEELTNDDVPNPYKTYEESYNGTNEILDVDDYVNNTKDAEAAAYSYDTYIGADLNLTYVDGNAVYGRVKKKFGTMMANM